MSDSDAAAEQVASALAGAEPLTIAQLAGVTGLHEREIDAILWNEPGRFVWQPGHRWSLKAVKSRRVTKTGDPKSVVDSRPELLASKPAKDLGAITLSSGLTLRMSRRALDSDAFFSVRSSGNVVELILNSTHEAFDRLPTPFDQVSADDASYKELAEMMLAAWALHEDAATGTAAKRSLEDVRHFWGRRLVEVMRE